MAIAKGNASQDAREFKRYIGVCTAFVDKINPTKAELENIYGTSLSENPVYVDTVEGKDGKSYKRAKIQLILNPDVEQNKIEIPPISVTFYIQDRYNVSSSGKTKVIDKYGRTAWVTEAELNTKSVPVYANGPANIDKNYRPMYVGEEQLVKFVKTFLWIPDTEVWDNNLRKFVPDSSVKLEECECYFDNISNLFKGDFSEVKDAIGFQPTNKIKVLLGIRTDINTGKLRQVVYLDNFLKSNVKNYSYLDKEIQKMNQGIIERGGTINTEYEVVPVHEYNVVATSFIPVETEAPSDDLPFSEETEFPY